MTQISLNPDTLLSGLIGALIGTAGTLIVFCISVARETRKDRARQRAGAAAFLVLPDVLFSLAIL